MCKAESTVIRAALKQTVNINCDIDANPMVSIELASIHHIINLTYCNWPWIPQSNLTFKWHFNNTLESVVELSANAGSHVGGDLSDFRDNPLAQHLQSTSQGDQPTSYSHMKYHRALLRNQQREEHVVSGHLFPYSIDTFANFGTVTCYAENSYGRSGPCHYHIIAAGRMEISKRSYLSVVPSHSFFRFIQQTCRIRSKSATPSTSPPVRCRFNAWLARTAVSRNSFMSKWRSRRRRICWWTSPSRCPSFCWSDCQVTRRSLSR